MILHSLYKFLRLLSQITRNILLIEQSSRKFYGKRFLWERFRLLKRCNIDFDPGVTRRTVKIISRNCVREAILRKICIYRYCDQISILITVQFRLRILLVLYSDITSISNTLFWILHAEITSRFLFMLIFVRRLDRAFSTHYYFRTTTWFLLVFIPRIFVREAIDTPSKIFSIFIKFIIGQI